MDNQSTTTTTKSSSCKPSFEIAAVAWQLKVKEKREVRGKGEEEEKERGEKKQANKTTIVGLEPTTPISKLPFSGRCD